MLVELRNMVASMAVLIAIVLVTGEPITLEWLLVVPILLLQALFNAGLAMGVRPAGRQVHRHPAADPVHHAGLAVRLRGALPGDRGSPTT